MTEQNPTSPPPSSPSSPPEREETAHVWTTQELLGEQREVLIQHGPDLYRLRITRHGKLILYK